MSKRINDMYDRVPLMRMKQNKNFLENTHKDRSLFFPQKNSCTGRHTWCRQPIALSSMHRNRIRSEVSDHTYRLHCDETKEQLCAGSMTLEMVVVLPLIATFLLFFLFLFRVLWVQESLGEALYYTSRTLAVTSFDEADGGVSSQAAYLTKAQLLLQKGIKDSDCPVDFIKGGRLGISLLQSDCTGDEIILNASYDMRLPCPLLGSYTYHLTQCARSRKWIGNRSLLEDAAGEDEWVYITPEGKVYHRSLSCNYLDLSIRAVNQSKLIMERNASGKRYRCCETCGGSARGTVYITSYGTRYHSSLSCSGLKRTIYMVKITQVGGRGACGKCAASSHS